MANSTSLCSCGPMILLTAGLGLALLGGALASVGTGGLLAAKFTFLKNLPLLTAIPKAVSVPSAIGGGLIFLYALCLLTTFVVGICKKPEGRRELEALNDID